MNVQGKTAIVTGGAMGIGKGIARQLAASGAKVIIADIDEETGPATVREFEEAGHAASFVRTDVARDDELHAVVGHASGEGGLDVFVNNAGIGMKGVMPGAPPEVWSDVIHVFLRQYMLGTQLAIEAMEGRGGAVVNIASSAGVGFAPHPWPEYATAKAGVMRFTACMAPQKERAGVRINCICPGWVATEGVRASLEGLTDEQRRKRNVPDVMLTPEDIGDAVLRFAEDDSLAGRVMLYEAPGRRRLVPAALDLFELSEEM